MKFETTIDSTTTMTELVDTVEHFIDYYIDCHIEGKSSDMVNEALEEIQKRFTE